MDDLSFLACTNRYWPTLTDRLWPDRLSHSLFGQLVWPMDRAGEGRGVEGREGGSGGHGAGGPVGAVPLEAVSGGGQHFAFFCRLPTLISYVSNLMWVFRGVVLVFWAFSFQKTLKRSGCHTVSREPRCVFFCQ